MKRIIITGIIILFFATACTKDNDYTSENSTLILLEVDYITNTFKQGKEYQYPLAIHADTDTIPVKAFFTPACDCELLVIRYEPTKDTIFSGTVGWHQNGKIETPSAFDSADSFELTPNTLSATLNSSQFQLIHIDESCTPSSFNPIWSSIRNLKKTQDYYSPSQKIGVFLYTPGIYADDGVNQHKKDWRWFIVMYK